MALKHVDFLPALLCGCFSSLLQKDLILVFIFFNLKFICRQDKDSKDEAAKAEKELEEISKVIEESGGKLSNRVMQCDVRSRNS